MTFVVRPVDDGFALAIGELRQILHVGRVDQVRLVTGDEMAVLGSHQVGLDEIGAQFDTQRIGFRVCSGR